MSNPLRVGLIGYGFAGKTFHAPLIQSISAMTLSRVASSQPAKVLADYPLVVVDSSPLATLNHPDIDLVVIASPNDSHASLAMQALQANKHVVIDKPFTLTVAEAEALLAEARFRHRLLSVFHNRRWDSDFLALQAVITSGRLGNVVHLESNFNRFRPEVRHRWREQDQPGGGLWYDLGPHLIDQALQLFGMPQSVTARLAKLRPGAVATDWVHVVLDYGRRQIVLQASVLVAGGMPRFAAHGTLASWTKFGLDTQEDSLRDGQQPGCMDWGLDPLHGTLYLGESGAVELLPVPSGDYRHYYQGIADSIQQGGANPVPPEQALAVMVVLEAALKSAKFNQTISLPTTVSTDKSTSSRAKQHKDSLTIDPANYN
nr:oxidoreductase [Chitinivorax sp. B]